MFESCTRCMQLILIAFNFIVLAAGAAAVAFGILALTDDDYGADELEDITGSDLYVAACIIIISAGGVIVVISFLGCCGAWTRNTCLLGTYLVIMLIFLVIFSVGAAIAFFYWDDVESELKDEMTSTLKDKYGSSDGVTDVWDKIQRDLECCGVDGDVTGDSSWFLWQDSDWFRDQGVTANPKYVPTSCCRDGFTFDECQKQNSNSSLPPQSTATALDDNPALFGNGCLDALKDEVEDLVFPLAVVGAIAGVVIFCAVLFSLCVCQQSRSKDQIA